MPNLYQSLLAALAPKQPVFVVNVVAVHDDGTSLVQFMGGSSAIASGASVPAGQKARVVSVDGKLEIRGAAPDLDQITIDVF